MAHLRRIAAAWDGPDRDRVFSDEFAAIKGISIDYAVLEHAPDVAVIEAPFGWDDLGGWSAVARQRGADGAGNTAVGRHLGIDSAGTIVHTDDRHLVVTLGLKDTLVVHTPDATLVADRAHEEAVRKVVAELEKRRSSAWRWPARRRPATRPDARATGWRPCGGRGRRSSGATARSATTGGSRSGPGTAAGGSATRATPWSARGKPRPAAGRLPRSRPTARFPPSAARR
jgi:hypothetical protein